jgi:GT2 family glycosyltransferase
VRALTEQSLRYGAVVIGRNEGERLKRCLRSLSATELVVYVDSGSTDGSVEAAAAAGAEVVRLDMTLPFTAARARNVGFARICELRPDLGYVQFIDGDCELDAEWVACAVQFLEENERVAAVGGRCRELNPSYSIYNLMCDWEWDGPIGLVRSIGGIAMMRKSALEDAGGFREDLIAGEEPELCVRLRSKGWLIWRLRNEMNLHDAAMTRFSQWWVRSSRAGYAYANNAYLHGRLPERFNVRETLRAWLWGFCIPLAGLIAVLLFGWYGLILFLVYPAQVLRLFVRTNGDFRRRATLAVFQVLARFPEVIGQAKFLINLVARQRPKLIEYK